MLHVSGQLHMLWGEAMHHTVWLKNCTTMKALDGDMTPYEAAYETQPLWSVQIG